MKLNGKITFSYEDLRYLVARVIADQLKIEVRIDDVEFHCPGTSSTLPEVEASWNSERPGVVLNSSMVGGAVIGGGDCGEADKT